MKKYTILTALLLATLSFGLTQSASAGVPLLVKTANSPQVYFVSQALGAKKVVVNEAAFNSYGNQWSWVKTVSQTTLDQYPDIRLIKTANRPEVYYITGSSKQFIPTDTVFNSWGFSRANIFVVNQTDLDSYRTGQPLITREQYTQNGTTPSTSVNTVNQKTTKPVVKKTGQLSISDKKYRDFDGGRIAPFTVFTALELKLSANSRQPVAINRLAFDIYGADSQLAIIDRAYLVDQYGNHITGEGVVIGRQVVFDLTGNPLIIDQAKTVLLKMSTTNGGYYIGAILRDVSSISSDAGKLKAQFPLQGQLYDVDKNRSFGAIRAFIMPISDQDSYNTAIGNRNQIMAKARLVEIGDDRPVQLNQISFVQAGSVTGREVVNYELVDEYGQVWASARYTRSSGNKIIFVLRRLLIIEPRGGVTLYVRADIRSGEGEYSTLTIVSADDINMSAPENNVAVGVPVTLVNPNVTFGIGRIINSNITIEQIGNRRLKLADDEIHLGSFVLSANDYPAKVSGLELMVISRGDKKPLNKVIIQHEDKSIGSIKFSSVNDQSALIELKKNVKIGGSDKYTFDVIGEIDDDADRDSEVQLVITGLDITNADGSVTGADWLVIGSRLLVFQD